MTRKQKEEAVRNMSTDALRRIVEAHGTERPSADKPLQGIVHIEGVGQVPVKALREELRRR